jgi:prolyl-tRNA editing enzyme YbaK/EbsC (Cys-tRNA(Pro) deacylase)
MAGCTTVQDAEPSIWCGHLAAVRRLRNVDGVPTMSLESVREFLAANAPDVPIIELEMSSDTMTLSAAWSIEPAQVAKTLSVRAGDRNVLLVTCGNARVDNKKAKAVLGGKVRMLRPEEAAAITGHPVGGVCPFGLATPLPIYCDVALRAFEEVVPAAGSTHAAIRINPIRLAELVDAKWVDVCEQQG